uniref:Uncharacterized protein n=1 Tax=Siphoviridae sp. ct1Eo1 TaxID=2825307 RepID=A0A8S5P7B9_9CAUD|nr:MAG TPA: hypothetical protein [Siphoviridae sp. ct1Eo1]
MYQFFNVSHVRHVFSALMINNKYLYFKVNCSPVNKWTKFF